MADEQPPPFRSLAESLGLVPERPAPEPTLEVKLVNIKDPKEFADAVIDSREFRQYIVDGLKIGTLPGFATLLKTIIERSTWGVTPTKTELTGKDGEPLNPVTEVRRVVVYTQPPEADPSEDESRPTTTH